MFGRSKVFYCSSTDPLVRDRIIKRGSEALVPEGRMAVLDFKVPEGRPALLTSLFEPLVRPFGAKA